MAFGKKWKHNHEAFEIEEKDGKLTAIWGSGSNRRKITGEISGKSAKINFYRQLTWVTDRESFDSGKSGLCFINSEGNKIHVMILEKDNSEFLDFELD